MAEREQAAGLWPIRRSLAVASITAVVGLVVVMTAVLAVLGFPHLRHEPLTTSRLLEVLKLVLGAVAGVGALSALVMAYRRQRLAEVAEMRDRDRAAFEQQRARDDLTRVFNERFGAASAQLGHDEPAVRLAGVYAMAGLADDWEQGRQTCIEVLCAVLRLPYAPDPGETPDQDQDPAEHAAARAAYRADREVRHTIIRIIGNHLRHDAPVSWQDHDLDFTDVIFDGGDLHDAVFTATSTSFQGARFVDGTVNFRRARFKGGTVDFERARFEGGAVDFRDAWFEGGTVYFGDARFKGGTVNFGGAQFVEGGRVYFGYAWFVGGTVNFGHALFEGGTVKFGRARFVGGTVNFGRAQFVEGGTVNFEDAQFDGGRVGFDGTIGRRPEGLPDGLADHLSH